MAIGDLVGTLSVPGIPGASFSLVSNPVGEFAIAGSSLVEAISAVPGIYSVTVAATAVGSVIPTRSLVLAFEGPILDLSVPSNVELLPGI
jgi:hypothetical protein